MYRNSAGGVGTSQFLDVKTLETMANKLDLLRLLETLLKKAREEYLPILQRQLAPNAALMELFSYADLLIRCLFAKAFRPDPQCKISTGKLSEQKARDLGVFWASKVNERYPDLLFPKEAGLEDLAFHGPLACLVCGCVASFTGFCFEVCLQLFVFWVSVLCVSVSLDFVGMHLLF